MNQAEKRHKEIRERIKAGKATPLTKVIRQHCIDCMGWQPAEVARCTSKECILHPFRMGKNPLIKKRVLSEEQKKKMVARLAKARQSK